MDNKHSYFCDNCGHHFESERDEYDVACPYCGDRTCYPDTPDGAAQSIKDTTEHENKMTAWED